MKNKKTILTQIFFVLLIMTTGYIQTWPLQSNRGDDKPDINVERRLLYVGMTRAEKYLYLTHANKRFLMGREYQLPRSPFFDQIEIELIELSKSEFKKSKKKDSGQINLFK